MALLQKVGVAHLAGRKPRTFSGGEAQRVAVARALARSPKLVLLDEPFSALDPNTRRRLRAGIERIWLQTGKTILFVTHDIDEALILADRIVLLSNKPTRVLEEIRIFAPRPRDVAADPSLFAIKKRLQDLFRSLEPQPTEESSP